MALGMIGLGGQPSGTAQIGEEAPISKVIGAYCSFDGGEQDAIGHLNRILIHVQRAKKIEDVVGMLGPYLTSEDGRIRTKAAALLGEVLNRLPNLPLNDAAVHHYIDFFASRLSDFPSLAGSLLALRALLQHHPVPTKKEADVIARAIFKDVHVPSMTQNIRQRAFEVFFEMMGPGSEPPPSVIVNMQVEFLKGLLNCLEGEKDPRCLILCLKVLAKAQTLSSEVADEYAEAIFDVTACYFPITFTPPPNDPYGITPDMLSSALKAALTARPSMAEYVLPLLVDKLSSNHVPAKLEALATLQVATRAYGLKAMRRNLPSVTSALFQEVVGCPEVAVVTAALETSRVLAAHLSNPSSSKGQDASTAAAAAEADWDAFVKGFVYKSIAEVKDSPNSMMGRACARLLGSVARASGRAFSAVLTAAVLGGLNLLKEEGEEGEAGSSKEAALELLVDLIDAVDPSVDYTASAEGPPLAQFVPQLYKALLECLQSTSPGPALLAVKGLASLATRSPSPLLTSEQSRELIVLFTSRLRAVEDQQEATPSNNATASSTPSLGSPSSHVAIDYDHDLAQALLNGLHTMSRRRPEYTATVLSHTLPNFMKWMDEASKSTRGSASDHCLAALAHLADQAEVFRAVIPALLSRVLILSSSSLAGGGDGSLYMLRPGEGTTNILSSLARIFTSTSKANREALPSLLSLPSSVDKAEDEGGAVEMEIDSNGTSDSLTKPCLWALLIAVLASSVVSSQKGGGGGDERRPPPLDDGAMDACLKIFSAATEHLSTPLQEIFASRVLHLFLPRFPISSLSKGRIPEPTSIEGLKPLDPAYYPRQHQALALLLVILASLDIRSEIFKAEGLKEELLQALLRLTLEAPLNSALEPASWGAALLLNKAAVPEVVQDAVHQQLEALKASGALLLPEGRLSVAQRDVVSLAWLTKSLAMRGGPKQSMDQAVYFLIDVAGAGAVSSSTSTSSAAVAEDEAGGGGTEGEEEEKEEPSADRIALALHAAEAFGLVLRDGPTQVLPPRSNVMRVNPLWRQRLFYSAFPRLRQAIDCHKDRPDAKAAALLAVCNIVAGLPKSIIQSELENILLVVIQGIQSNNETLRSCATDTFASMVKDSIESIVPHLSTIIPLLYNLCSPSFPLFLPKARLRVLALQSLLELTRLPYAKLHPFRSQVARGLLAPLDDKKRSVRQMAVKVRNEWMMMGQGHG